MEERAVKQVIVMRKDLNMRKGKMIAQGSHASVDALLSLFSCTEADGKTTFTLTYGDDSPLAEWLTDCTPRFVFTSTPRRSLLRFISAYKMRIRKFRFR